MFDDLFNAGILALLCAIGTAAATSAFHTDAGAPPATAQVVQQPQVVVLPRIVIAARRPSTVRDVALASDE